uniref:Exostosin GT47 domain-containing protein n=1 Tax=Craspedostauros australis TaxID=1486917 RepID=A0A7R9ZM04_9STRA|mmetsp:Transcript_15789/g.43590  ORF Transcript_15789/g.43590 Transcript_15789/m.43590 type:complete len:258 (+) Transcript_15789:1-774(+)
MADEFMSHQLFSAYGTFDYVLRHYFASDGKQPNITQPLRALGNLTCGANAEREQAQLMRDGNDRQPKYGIHWAFLLEDHPIFSAELHSQPWPIQLRPTNCSFSGRQTPKRLAMQRQIQQWQQRSKNDLSCSITFTKGFRLGISAFQYAVKEIGRAKIGLHPSGNNDECYRLGEMLSLGTVPALLDSPFLHATYKQVPAIIGTTWPDVARRALSLLRDEQNGGTRLQELSSQGAEFWKNLQTCMQDDMNIILRRAFNG